MRKTKYAAIALIAATSLSTVLFFQNCAEPLPSASLPSNDGGGGLGGTLPSFSLGALTVTTGSTINPTISFQNIDSDYTVQWEILDPNSGNLSVAAGNFNVTSGVVSIVSGQTEASISIQSTAVDGSGNKSFQLRLSESTNKFIAVAVPLNVVDDGLPTVVAAAFASSCAAVNGIAKCWGYNNFGDLGVGDGTDRAIPVNVIGLPAASKVEKIYRGGDNSCAVLQTGALYCWGANGSGQIGNGVAGNNYASAIAVTGMETGVTAVAIGSDQNNGGNNRGHICAIKNGGLYCWGRNDQGQLGLGDQVQRNGATPVPNMATGVTHVAAGDRFTCAIQNGAAKCWGTNGSGQIGDGTQVIRLVPTQVLNLTAGVTNISGGTNHACAVHNGAAKCWGLNSSGQLGDMTNVTKTIATQVNGLNAGVTQVTTGEAHSCAIQNGSAQCWGNNSNFNLGDGSNVSRLIPGPVTGLTTGVDSISTGSRAVHTCATKAGAVYCWGPGNNGRLGYGNAANRANANTPITF